MAYALVKHTQIKTYLSITQERHSPTGTRLITLPIASINWLVMLWWWAASFHPPTVPDPIKFLLYGCELFYCFINPVLTSSAIFFRMVTYAIRN